MAKSEDPIIRFARDISNNDPMIVQRVTEYLKVPPTAMEEIGYYGAADLPERVRIWLATVSDLQNGSYLHGSEDKYTSEQATLWEEDGLIDQKRFGAAAKLVFGAPPFDEDPSTVEKFAEEFKANYSAATEEIERQMLDRGKVLLSVDDAGGDTMAFAAVSPEIAGRWKNKGLAQNGDEQFGVRTPDWRRFWNHLTYSLGIDDMVDAPDNLPMREKDLPMAE